jgi:hypothetical protein
MSNVFMAAGAVMCTFGVLFAANRFYLRDDLARLEAKMNLVLKKMDIAFPPPPSVGVQNIARTQRIAAIKAYREETGIGLKEAVNVIDKWQSTR